MAPKGPKTPDATSTPSDFAQVPPRDLYPTSDIRFVMVEVGKLTANVERLISDVKSQGDKVDGIRHQVSFIKGAFWASAGLVATLIAVGSFFLSAKWDALLTAIKAIPK